MLTFLCEVWLFLFLCLDAPSTHTHTHFLHNRVILQRVIQAINMAFGNVFPSDLAHCFLGVAPVASKTEVKFPYTDNKVYLKLILTLKMDKCLCLWQHCYMPPLLISLVLHYNLFSNPLESNRFDVFSVLHEPLVTCSSLCGAHSREEVERWRRTALKTLLLDEYYKMRQNYTQNEE